MKINKKILLTAILLSAVAPLQEAAYAKAHVKVQQNESKQIKDENKNDANDVIMETLALAVKKMSVDPTYLSKNSEIRNGFSSLDKLSLIHAIHHDLYAKDDSEFVKVSAAKNDVKIIIFADYNCAFCVKAEKVVGDFLKIEKGVDFSERMIPILGKNSYALQLLAGYLYKTDPVGFLKLDESIWQRGLSKPIDYEFIKKASNDIDFGSKITDEFQNEYDRSIVKNMKMFDSLKGTGTPVMLIVPTDPSKLSSETISLSYGFSLDGGELNVDSLSSRVAKIRSELSGLDNKRGSIDKEFLSMSSDIKNVKKVRSLNNDVNETKKQLKNALLDSKDTLSNVYSKWNSQLSSLGSSLPELLKNGNKIVSDKGLQGKNVLDKSVSDLENFGAKIKNEIDIKLNELKTKTNQASDLATKNIELEKKIDELNKKKASIETTLNDKVMQLEVKVKELSDDKIKLENKTEKMAIEAKKSEKVIKELINSKTKLQASVKSLSAKNIKHKSKTKS